MLLDRVDVQPFQLHHGLDVTFECIDLPKPAKSKKVLLLIQFTRKHPTKKDPFERKKERKICHLVLCSELAIPCNFSSSLGLLSDLRQLPIAVLVIKDAGSLPGLKTVKSPLSMSPLGFSLLFTVIFLGGECGLLNRQNRAKGNQLSHFAHLNVGQLLYVVL